MKMRLIIMVSLFGALCMSFLNNRTDALENMRFNLGLSDQEKQKAAVIAAIDQYNKNSAGFYNSAGSLAGLEEIPATPLLKRNIFKDINMLKGDGLVMVFDKDAVEVKKVYFKRRDVAVAETREVWAISLQKLETRKPVFNLKAAEVNVRYQFYKDKGGWIAYEVDVYPRDEKVPEVSWDPAL